MTRYLATGLVFFTMGCAQVSAPDIHSASENAFPADLQVAAPVAVYSTYLSNAAREQCASLLKDQQSRQQKARQNCEEDAISADTFFAALQQENYFTEAVASAEGVDYEVLIANQAATIHDANWFEHSLHFLSAQQWHLPTQTHYFTEVTIHWRGLEIDSQLIHTTIEEVNADPLPMAQSILRQWWQLAQQKELFTAAFLYEAIDASDYLNDMQVPERIDAFTRTDTQLYHDPFKGAVTRYTHAEFEGALLDINVYPEMGAQNADNVDPSAGLQEVLEQELRDASVVAEARDLSLAVDQPISEFVITTPDGQIKGKMLALHASAPDSEPLFASTYVFHQQDKIIKLSTTFPPRVANPLIEQAMPAIKVPPQSALMAALRDLAVQQAAGGR